MRTGVSGRGAGNQGIGEELKMLSNEMEFDKDIR
jgi:hypothetical protein